MSSCSSELRVKASKPKMSSSPIFRFESVPAAALRPIIALTRPSNHSNKLPYAAFARASRAAAAFAGGCGTCTTGNLPTLLTVSACSSEGGATANISETARKLDSHRLATHEPSSCCESCTGSNSRLPRCSSPANTRRTKRCSSAEILKSSIASQVERHCIRSSSPATCICAEPPMYLISGGGGSCSSFRCSSEQPLHNWYRTW
mmetsp:Transcript_36061/g.84206  ORF Transcript_36061/g.84206 Transcript_36061/m.84206 type:complete len:204 (-) Transcript_36061:885-1496(-)